MNNPLLRFIIRARNDTLWTPANGCVCIHDGGGLCHCGTGELRLGNLLHVLNNCNMHSYAHEMTCRHDMVVQKVVEMIDCHRTVWDTIKSNETVEVEGFRPLSVKIEGPGQSYIIGLKILIKQEEQKGSYG